MRLVIAIIIMTLAQFAISSEAPPGMKQFNITCPAKELLPKLDHYYHECSHAFSNGSCDKFVQTFKKLLPEYDCQRPFDNTPDKKYIVPAIWLAGDAALEDYVDLLYKLASNNPGYSYKWLESARSEAKIIFLSKEFGNVLDGALAEEYFPLIKKLK